jgi:hypothetical protein
MIYPSLGRLNEHIYGEFAATTRVAEMEFDFCEHRGSGAIGEFSIASDRATETQGKMIHG